MESGIRKLNVALERICGDTTAIVHKAVCKLQQEISHYSGDISTVKSKSATSDWTQYTFCSLFETSLLRYSIWCERPYSGGGW